MKIIVHRGTHEIGGSCVEIATASTRLIVDIGMPLVQPGDKNKKLESLPLTKKSSDELKKLGILPSIEGLYPGAGSTVHVDGLLLSHPHQDHYGLIQHIDPGIPVYLSDGARRIIAASDIFLPLKARIRKPVVIHDRVPFKIGDIEVTPFLVDHSGFGAMSFLIEGEGNRVFYTGDFRGHGRKAALFSRTLRHPPKDVDCLLMEGTTLGRPGRRAETEDELETKIVALAQKWPGLKLVYASGQNIDRLVSFYKAAQRIQGFLVVDLYTAYILDCLGSNSIPHPSKSFSRLKVFYTEYLMKKIAREGLSHLFAKYRPYEITPDSISRAPGKFFMMYRDSLRADVERIGKFDGAVLIYSQYHGYRQESSFAKVEDFLTVHGVGLESAHTSGHAPRVDLERLIRAIKPCVLTPIHTFDPGSYYEMWHTVKPLEDGDVFDLEREIAAV